MRTPMVAGNWKMNGSKASVRQLLQDLVSKVAGNSVEVVVCPPAIFMGQAQEALADSSLSLAAQNVCTHLQGAYTGEISATMAVEFDCHYSLLGHSERRSYYGDTDEIVVQKFEACKQAGLTPIVCVGESLDQRQQDRTAAVVTTQLGAVLASAGKDEFRGAIVAYEPVWAIGTGVSATPDQAEEVHRLIRAQLAELDEELADRTRILYGGSVTAENATALFGNENVDGALVGGASLKSADFVSICEAAS